MAMRVEGIEPRTRAKLGAGQAFGPCLPPACRQTGQAGQSYPPAKAGPKFWVNVMGEEGIEPSASVLLAPH